MSSQAIARGHAHIHRAKYHQPANFPVSCRMITFSSSVASYQAQEEALRFSTGAGPSGHDSFQRAMASIATHAFAILTSPMSELRHNDLSTDGAELDEDA